MQVWQFNYLTLFTDMALIYNKDCLETVEHCMIYFIVKIILPPFVFSRDVLRVVPLSL